MLDFHYAMKQRCYAVFRGHRAGIYLNPQEAIDQIRGAKRPKMRRYDCWAAAKQLLLEECAKGKVADYSAAGYRPVELAELKLRLTNLPEEACLPRYEIYCDGSYSIQSRIGGAMAIVIFENEIIAQTKLSKHDAGGAFECELQAAITGVLTIPPQSEAIIYSDNQALVELWENGSFDKHPMLKLLETLMEEHQLKLTIVKAPRAKVQNADLGAREARLRLALMRAETIATE